MVNVRCLVTQLCLILCYPMDCSRQVPLSMRFYSQEYWGGLPFPFPGNLPNPGIEPGSPALQVLGKPAELVLICPFYSENAKV